MSRTDEATLGWVLEAINVRLSFLDRLNAEMIPTKPGRKAPDRNPRLFSQRGNGG